MKIQVVFWDIGGVLLSNGFDEASRLKIVGEFGLDGAEFERRHAALNPALERGELSFDAYLDQSVFDQARPFSKDTFRARIFAESLPRSETLDFVRALARARRCFFAALNNESAALNAYRIERYGLRELFPVFFSSCYLGLLKPDAAIYLKALELTQQAPEDCVFIDDREANVHAASRLGLRSIHYQSAAQLQAALLGLGLKP